MHGTWACVEGSEMSIGTLDARRKAATDNYRKLLHAQWDAIRALEMLRMRMTICHQEVTPLNVYIAQLNVAMDTVQKSSSDVLQIISDKIMQLRQK